MHLKQIVIALLVLLCNTALVAQNTERKERVRKKLPQDTVQNVVYKNTIGIDVANIIPFFAKKNESYLINYKRLLSPKNVLRTGLNVEWSTSKDGYKGVGIKIGYERAYQIVSRHWRLHWGMDASFRYLASNFQPNKSFRYGISPIVGFSYFPVRRFSISTEVGVNFFYTDFRNPDSYDPRDNANVWDINVGSVGMLVISYHF